MQEKEWPKTLINWDTIVEPIEVLTWSWTYWRFQLVAVPITGLVAAWAFGLTIGLIVALISGLFFGLIGGFSGNQLTEHLILSPNEGIRRSAKNGLLLGLAAWLISGAGIELGIELIFKQSIGLTSQLLWGLGGGLIVGLLFGINRGLKAVIQYLLLRFWLWRTHFPWRAVPFLEDATIRILLKRVGGGYSFTHQLLLEYFANLDSSSPPSSKP